MTAAGSHFIRVDFNDVKVIAIKVANLDIRCECRYGEGYFVTSMQQVVYHERVEDVAHCGCSTLYRKNIEIAGNRFSAAHLLGQVMLRDFFSVNQHTARDRILVADDAVDQFMEKRIRIEAEFTDAVVNRGPNHVGARGITILVEKTR